ncbi:hypothetical protein C8Q74DRAFT_1208005 [Fomes fomentarius]|nr:hypothetical protein C8Q74DRAFT_1208005 [Fomes fomentarius]
MYVRTSFIPLRLLDTRQIPAQLAYTREKIEPSAFSSGATVNALIHDLEALFAVRFARGDKKKALARLRGGAKHTSHHFSTFRTGMALGLAIPALVSGIYQSESQYSLVLRQPMMLNVWHRLPTRNPSRDTRVGRPAVHIWDILRTDVLRASRRSEPAGLVACSYQLCLHFRCVLQPASFHIPF